MKITDYTQVTTAGENDIFLIDGDNGTKTITAKNALKSIPSIDPNSEWLSAIPSKALATVSETADTDGLLLAVSDGTKQVLTKDLIFSIIDMLACDTYNSEGEPSSLGLKRSFYRGKNLGNTLTDEQSAHIKDGTFRDLFVGDYWLINDIRWRIADYIRYGTGDSRTSALTIMPDKPILLNQQMNTSDTVTGGYESSAMATNYLNNAVDIAVSAFGDEHVNTITYIACNAVSNGAEASAAYNSSKRCVIPSEQEVMGCLINTYKRYGIDGWPQGGSNKTQLALFMLNPELIWRTPDGETTGGWWLRDVCSSKCFCGIWKNGRPGPYFAASGDGSGNLPGVRPLFAIS